MDTHSLQAPRIALLIDFDNVILGVEEPPGFDIELVVNALRSRGVIVLGRAYGDWYRHHRHRRKLMDHGIELVETPAFGPIIKNSADIRIALDGFEIGMTQHHITEICLVSGDSDFLPLIKRLQYLGKTVTVISGVKFTSDLVRRNCNEFISYENLLADSVGATEDATVLEGAFALLVRTINTLHERGMEVRSSTVKQMMIQLNPVFSERTFGCAQFKQFLDKACRAGLIKLGTRDVNSGEYNVLLPGDFEEETEGAAEVAEPAAEKPARAPRRGRGRRVQSADEDLSLEVVEGEVESGEAQAEAETASLENGARETASREASAREALRQGRLRSSGRTWKGKATTRSILQGALSSADTPDSPAVVEAEEVSEILPAESTPEATENTASVEQAAAELVAADGGVATEEPEAAVEPEAATAETVEIPAAKAEPAEAAAAGDDAAESPAPEAEEKPKRAPRRRRKPAAKKAEAAPAGDETETSAEPSTPAAEAAPEPAAEAAPEVAPEATPEPAEGEEKKAAKKPVRRRSPRKKKEEPKAEAGEG